MAQSASASDAANGKHVGRWDWAGFGGEQQYFDVVFDPAHPTASTITTKGGKPRPIKWLNDSVFYEVNANAERDIWYYIWDSSRGVYHSIKRKEGDTPVYSGPQGPVEASKHFGKFRWSNDRLDFDLRSEDGVPMMYWETDYRRIVYFNNDAFYECVLNTPRTGYWYYFWDDAKGQWHAIMLHKGDHPVESPKLYKHGNL